MKAPSSKIMGHGSAMVGVVLHALKGVSIFGSGCCQPCFVMFQSASSFTTPVVFQHQPSTSRSIT
jgi:hypothetical protein